MKVRQLSTKHGALHPLAGSRLFVKDPSSWYFDAHVWTAEFWELPKPAGPQTPSGCQRVIRLSGGIACQWARAAGYALYPELAAGDRLRWSTRGRDFDR